MSKGLENCLLIAYNGKIEDTEEVHTVGIFIKSNLAGVIKGILEDESETELTGEDLNFAYIPVHGLTHISYSREIKVKVNDP